VLSSFSPFWAPSSDLHLENTNYPHLPAAVVSALIDCALAHLKTQPAVLDVPGDVVIVGDLHGSIFDLLRILKKFGRPPGTSYLFLGDYVDRGPDSVSVIALVLALLCRVPGHVFLIRGNHEFSHVNEGYGFLEEIRSKFGGDAIWKAANDLFAWLAVAAVVGGALFCVHGGLSPLLESLDDLRSLQLPIATYEPNSMLADLMWSDPVDGFWGFQANSRGSGKIFGHDRVEAFLKRNKLRLLVRAHQCNEQGCRIFGNMTGVTVFSASNYCQVSRNKCGVIDFRGVNDIFVWTLDPWREALPAHWTLAPDGGIGMRKRPRTMSNAELDKEAAAKVVDTVIRSHSFAPWSQGT
jgi:diadenosine tetraphosphatase ApaH/serine/threonine PP2A family protein phosphatase